MLYDKALVQYAGEDFTEAQYRLSPEQNPEWQDMHIFEQEHVFYDL